MAKAVVVMPWSSGWQTAYARVREELLPWFPPGSVRIEHIGSTAVDGLCAKPVLDLLLGAPALAVIETAIPALAALGYDYIRRHEQELPERRYFVRPADDGRGRMRVHLHGVVEGSPIWRQQLHFRDSLRADPELCGQYAALKRQLAEVHAADKSAYQAAKAPFIQAVLAGAPVHD